MLLPACFPVHWFNSLGERGGDTWRYPKPFMTEGRGYLEVSQTVHDRGEGHLEVSQTVHDRGEGIPGGIPNRS